MNFGLAISLINRKVKWVSDMGCELYYAERICVVRIHEPNFLGVKGTAQFQLKSTVS